MRRLTPTDVGEIWLGVGMLCVMSATALRIHFRGIDPFLGSALPVGIGSLGAVFVWKAVGRLVC